MEIKRLRYDTSRPFRLAYRARPKLISAAREAPDFHRDIAVGMRSLTTFGEIHAGLRSSRSQPWAVPTRSGYSNSVGEETRAISAAYGEHRKGRRGDLGQPNSERSDS